MYCRARRYNKMSLLRGHDNIDVADFGGYSAGRFKAVPRELDGKNWQMGRQWTHKQQQTNGEIHKLLKSKQLGPVAQSVEQGTHNPLVAGSSPAGPSS
jgi:hypothetical protein